MSRSGLGTYSLFLSIILWGTLIGGIAYSHIVYFPPYLSALPDSAVVVNGPYGLDETTFWMIIHPMLILSLVITLALNWNFTPRRKLILTTFTIYLVILGASMGFFIPELIAFQKSPGSDVSPAEWLERANRWQTLSWIRGAMAYASMLPLLVALTRSVDPHSESVSRGS